MNNKENYDWYRSYDICDKYMRFYSYKEFCDNAELFKTKYECVNDKVKKIYKLFVYAGAIRYDQKNAIWDYLNNYIDKDALKYHN